MTSRARPGISKGLLAQLIALVRADEAGSVGDETEMVDLGGIAAAAVPSGSRQHSPLEWTSSSPGGRHRCPSLRFQRARTRLLFVWATEIARCRPQHRAGKSVP
jgi:hypothetical protein